MVLVSLEKKYINALQEKSNLLWTGHIEWKSLLGLQKD